MWCHQSTVSLHAWVCLIYMSEPVSCRRHRVSPLKPVPICAFNAGVSAPLSPRSSWRRLGLTLSTLRTGRASCLINPPGVQAFSGWTAWAQRCAEDHRSRRMRPCICRSANPALWPRRCLCMRLFAAQPSRELNTYFLACAAWLMGRVLESRRPSNGHVFLYTHIQATAF